MNNTCVNNQYGISNIGWSSLAEIYGNTIGWNFLNNSLDDTVGGYGQWDDGVSVGNYWGDYTGALSYYMISGLAHSVDHYPSKADTSPPSISSPSDFYCEDDSGGNSITWFVDEDHISECQLTRNGTPVAISVWQGLVIVGVDELGLGTYVFVLSVIDTCANSANDTVLVTVGDTVAPSLSSPPDFSYDCGTTGNQILWDVSDANPHLYRIDGNAMTVGWTSWLSGEVSIDVDGLVVGVFDFTISVVDTNGNMATDTVHVTVVDGTPPCIDSPDDLTYNEGDTGYSIIWVPTDSYPASYEILKDGVVVSSGSWNSSVETLTVAVDGLTVGVYTYTAFVVDIGGNSNSDTVLVTVRDGTPPTLDHPNDITYEVGTINRSITWSPQDKYPTEYRILKNGQAIESSSWSSSESITISVDGLGLGVYNYTLIAYDFGGNYAIDTVLVTVVDTTRPTIDSPDDIDYAEGTTGSVILWHPYDLLPSSYEILQNGTVVASGIWDGSAIEISVDGLVHGSYNYTLVVSDSSDNRASDTVFIRVLPNVTTTNNGANDLQWISPLVAGTVIGGIACTIIALIVTRRRAK